MVGASKILTVSYGTFSCTLEGFDDPFSAMKSIAEYFRDLAAEDRYFGAEPPTPDAEMLHQIAEREAQRRVETRVRDSGNGIVLRQIDGDGPAPQPQTQPPAEAKEPADAVPFDQAQGADEDSVAAKLSRIRAVVERARSAAPAAALAATDYEDLIEDTADSTVTAFMPPYEAPSDYPAQDEPAAEAAIDLSADEDLPEEDGSSVEEMISGLTAAEIDEAEEQFAVEDQPAETDGAAEELAAVDFEDEETAPTDASESPADEGMASDEVRDETPPAEAVADDNASDDLMPEEAEGSDEAEPASVAEAEKDIPAYDPAAPVMAMAMSQVRHAAEPSEEDAAPADEAALEDASEAETEEETSEDLYDAEAEMDAPEAEMAEAEIDAGEMDEVEPDMSEAEIAWSDDAAAESVEDEADIEPAGDEIAAEDAQTEPESLADRIVRLKEAETRHGVLTEDDDDNAPTEADEARIASDKQDRRRVLIGGDPATQPSFDRILEETNSKMAESEGTRRRSAIAHLKAAVAATKADRLLKRDRSPEGSEREQSQYREDLAKVVRPRPSEPRENAAEREAEKAAAVEGGMPLMLVSSQRVDGGAAGPADTDEMAVRPRRIGAGMLALDQADRIDDEDDDEDFVEFATSLGARDLPDLLEAAAAYTSFIEGQPHFSRPQIMRRAAAIEIDEEFTREAGLRSFGQLLRQGRIRKLQRGQFTIAENTRFNPSRRIAGE